MVSSLYETERLCGQDVARNDEENGHREVAAGEEVPDSGEGDEVELVLITKSIFEDAILNVWLMSPQLVVMDVNQEGSEASKTVKICGRPQCF